jgi:hypothetical protein
MKEKGRLIFGFGLKRLVSEGVVDFLSRVVLRSRDSDAPIFRDVSERLLLAGKAMHCVHVLYREYLEYIAIERRVLIHSTVWSP